MFNDGAGEAAVTLVGYDAGRVPTGDCVITCGPAAERDTGDSEVVPISTGLYGDGVVVDERRPLQERECRVSRSDD